MTASLSACHKSTLELCAQCSLTLTLSLSVSSSTLFALGKPAVGLNRKLVKFFLGGGGAPEIDVLLLLGGADVFLLIFDWQQACLCIHVSLVQVVVGAVCVCVCVMYVCAHVSLCVWVCVCVCDIDFDLLQFFVTILYLYNICNAVMLFVMFLFAATWISPWGQ